MLVFTANLAAVGVCSRIIAAEKQFLEFLCIYTCGECMYACVARGFFCAVARKREFDENDGYIWERDKVCEESRSHNSAY